MLACTCTATSARAWLVSATSPSIPAVPRPVLRCVTCRTLTSVLAQLRSISFCKFLASGQSPSRTALKILPRSRRTRSSWPRQSTCSQASPSNEGRPSGPFTEVSNVPVSSGINARFASKAHLTASAPFRARHQPVSGQLYERHPEETRTRDAAFPLPFGRRRSLLSHPVPPGTSAPLTVGLPSCLRIPAPARRTLARFPRSARMRPGPGRAPSLPRGQRCLPATTHARPPPAASQRPVPATPETNPARDAYVTRHQQGFPDSRPSGPSPH